MNHRKATIRLRDGPEVWRSVTVRYREVKSRKYLSDNEVESLSDIRLTPENPDNQDALMQEILAAQARLAVDPEAGSKGTSAARVVMQILRSMEELSTILLGDTPAYVLGRDLAAGLLAQLAASAKTEIG